MKSSGKTGHFVHAGGLATLMLLGACDRPPEPRVAETVQQSLPPAIIPPAEGADSAEPPSYEVGIAAAAADRNRAKEKCAEKSDRLRAICDAEADAAFTSAQSGLDGLRGNQQ